MYFKEQLYQYYHYTGWPRKNATTLIDINFMNIVDETELFFYFIW